LQNDTEEDTTVIWNLWESKGYGAQRLIQTVAELQVYIMPELHHRHQRKFIYQYSNFTHYTQLHLL